LMTRRSRELAYVYAYLLVVSDEQISRVEGRFLEDLQRELGISDERAAELAATSAEQVTPDAAELGTYEPARSPVHGSSASIPGGGSAPMPRYSAAVAARNASTTCRCCSSSGSSLSIASVARVSKETARA